MTSRNFALSGREQMKKRQDPVLQESREYSIDTRTSVRYKKQDPESFCSNVPMIGTPTFLQCYVETAYHC